MGQAGGFLSVSIAVEAPTGFPAHRQPEPVGGRPGLVSVSVSQLSFFTAESVPPAVADLSGVLAASGQIVMVGAPDAQGARLSGVVDVLWRATGLPWRCG